MNRVSSTGTGYSGHYETRRQNSASITDTAQAHFISDSSRTGELYMYKLSVYTKRCSLYSKLWLPRNRASARCFGRLSRAVIAGSRKKGSNATIIRPWNTFTGRKQQLSPLVYVDISGMYESPSGHNIQQALILGEHISLLP
jgi:hypothetical protein